MPQGNPEGYLTEELMQDGAPATQDGAQAGISSLRPLVTNEMEDFLLTLMEFADSRGALDDAMNPNAEATIEDRISAIDEDIFEDLSRDELITLVSKFKKIPQEVQTQLLEMLKNEDPKLYSRVEAAIRMFDRGMQ